MCGQVIPAALDNLAKVITFHLVCQHLTEELLALVGTDGDEVCALLCVIISM
jgi:hypothetical protein